MESVKIPLALFWILVGCGGVRYPSETAPSASSSNGSTHKNSFLDRLKNFGYSDASPLRNRSVQFAEQRLAAQTQRADFGQSDLSDLFDALKIRTDWSQHKPLSKLLSAAKRRDAYDPKALPVRGDIVLFHNQVDRNQNHMTDDWLTGCGVVTEVKGKTFFVLVRTGRGPRLVGVTPDTPSVRERNGVVINSFLRVPAASDPKDADYLAGLLYAGRIDLERLAGR